MKITEFAKKYFFDAVSKTSRKKRYEVHYQATAPDGHIYSFIKEAICTPGELRGILKKVEEEQKAKGVTLRRDYTKTIAVDAAGEKYFLEVLSANGRVIAKIKAPEQFSSYIGDRLAEQEAKKKKKQWASWRVVDSNGRRFESGKRNKPWSATRELISQNIDSAEFENDGYDLGINIPENVSKEPVKVIAVSTKKRARWN